MSAADTRDAIRVAAARLFAERGYAGASVRDIAGEAGIDAALVIRHFGSKEALFLGTVEAALPLDVALEGPLDGLGERFLRSLLASDEHVRGIFLALVRASDTGGVGLRLREVHDRFFVEPLRARLDGDDAELRARLAAAVVGGLLYSLWVVEDAALAAAGPDELARRYGAVLQAIITPRG